MGNEIDITKMDENKIKKKMVMKNREKIIDYLSKTTPVA